MHEARLHDDHLVARPHCAEDEDSGVEDDASDDMALLVGAAASLELAGASLEDAGALDAAGASLLEAAGASDALDAAEASLAAGAAGAGNGLGDFDSVDR